MIAARERLGLSQKELATQSCVPLHWIVMFEKLDFGAVGKGSVGAAYARQLAEFLGLQGYEVMPEELAGIRLETTRVDIADVSPLELGRASDSYLIECPVEAIGQREHAELLLCALSAKQREVVELRFGLGGDKPMSLGEVAKRVGLSRERVRQIVAFALNLMRKRDGNLK